MTAFTLNGGGTTKWDSLSGGSTNATLDTYTISAGTKLLIDTDSYQCAGHSAAAGSLDTVSYTGIGGTLEIDPTGVKIIPYDTGTGNVPAIGTTISQGGATITAYLLGVWSGWQSEPVAAGSAMPATGFIKVKTVSGNFSAGAITGIGASATGQQVQGWIEVRGPDTGTLTVPRIGKFVVKQAWFELGTTNGSRNQVLPCPTTGGASIYTIPGIWIETSAGSGVYDRYVSMASKAAVSTDPTDSRGCVFWQTTGGIRIGYDGTNNVGYLPPTGCKVRIPAAILTCCTRTAGGSGARVQPNATLATRYEFVTTSAGDIKIDGSVMNWYANFAQAYRVIAKNSAISDTLALSEVSSTPPEIDNVIVSFTSTTQFSALNLSTCVGGGTVSNSVFARYTLNTTNTYNVVYTYCRGWSFDNVVSRIALNRTHATTYGWSNWFNYDSTFNNCTCIGAQFRIYGGDNLTVTNLHYSDVFSGVTGTTYAHSAEDVQYASNVLIDGIDWGGWTACPAYLRVLNVADCSDVTLRNVGTYAAPLDLAGGGSTTYASAQLFATARMFRLRVQRCYVTNTRTNLFADSNADLYSEYQDTAGDTLDTAVVAALNATSRGLGMLGAVTGMSSVYGTHWIDKYTSATTARIEVLCNEPNADSADQCAITAGTPKFNSLGQALLTTVGDQVTWETPYFIKGHTAANNSAPTLTGTNTGNLTYEFQYDLGSGYSSWATLNQTNWFAVGAIDPAVGIRLKIRATCATAAINALTNIRVTTDTTAIAQSTNQYPLDEYTVTFTGLPTGTDVVVLTAGTTTILDQQDAGAGTTYSYTYSAVATVDVGFIKHGYVPYYIRNLALTEADSTLPISLTPDRNFS